MPTFEYDRRYLEQGLEMLENYLLADAAYWPVNLKPPSGEPPYPMLTLEGLLLSSHRLLAYRGNVSQEAQAEKLSSELQTVRSHWRVAWEKKTGRAHRARIRMWHNYLEEYLGKPDLHADRYPYEVRLRVFISLLEKDTGSSDPGVEGNLPGLDNILRMLLSPGEFIWEKEIQPGFPANHYWYLYGRLPIILVKRNVGSEMDAGG